MKKIIIKILIGIVIFIIGAVASAMYIINNAKITLIERTDYGELIHYELLWQDFGYFMEYYDMEEI